ncbi:hypothetical protein C4M96_00270 [Mycoplasmopsis pullorum]|uniref:Uncharacterized protein n=1 Tax=Mycoplasmopsis pullorum TaxID=48003 RepID=A0A1L4FSE0_9BACT|nr:hypothetical protein BLA55_02510 [Mycoplasmopsis pullorum]TNK83974.1 hypothetical protein C4M93_00505 [Mycoplasmopsis pullorum]TNK92550.1 hypothetical protein C4M96_00270 [Mycoplasmopsis pullorum]
MNQKNLLNNKNKKNTFYYFRNSKFFKKIKRIYYLTIYNFKTSWYHKAFELSQNFFQINNLAVIDYKTFQKNLKINSKRSWNISIRESIKVFSNKENEELLKNFFIFFILQVYKKFYKRKIYSRVFRNNPYFKSKTKYDHIDLDHVKRKYYYKFLKNIENTPNHNEYIIKLLKILN